MAYSIEREGGFPGRMSSLRVAVAFLVSFLMITRNSYVSFSCMLIVSNVSSHPVTCTGPGPSLKHPPLSVNRWTLAAVFGTDGFVLLKLPLGCLGKSSSTCRQNHSQSVSPCQTENSYTYMYIGTNSCHYGHYLLV